MISWSNANAALTELWHLWWSLPPNEQEKLREAILRATKLLKKR